MINSFILTIAIQKGLLWGHFLPLLLSYSGVISLTSAHMEQQKHKGLYC